MPLSDKRLGKNRREGSITQESKKRLKWLKLTEYVFLVDSVVELQNIFYVSSAKLISPISSPNSRILSTRPEQVGDNQENKSVKKNKKETILYEFNHMSSRKY